MQTAQHPETVQAHGPPAEIIASSPSATTSQPLATIATIAVSVDPGLEAILDRSAIAAGLVRYATAPWRDIKENGIRQPATYTALLGVSREDDVLIVSHVSDRCRDSYLIVTVAKGMRTSRANLFDSGADEYFDEPVDEAEMTARLRAAERRRLRGFGSIKAGDLKLSPLTRRLECDGKCVQLTPIEGSLLALFMSNVDRTLSIREMARAVWGNAYVGSHDPYKQVVGRLRRKLARIGAPASIRTIWSEGYRMESNSIVPESPLLGRSNGVLLVTPDVGALAP